MNKYNLSSNGALTQNSSGGKLLKWKIENKFIKTSTYDQSQLRPVFLYESYAEVIAYRIAKHLKFNAIPYRLCEVTIDNSISTIACECDDFRINNEQYNSIGKLMRNNIIPPLYYGEADNYNKLLKYMSIVPGFELHLKQTLLLDSLILNDDRHYGNFGILQNKHGGCRPAPIFDNGNSLFCHKHTDEMEYRDDLISYIRCKPFAPDFNNQLELIDIQIDTSSLKKYIYNLLNNLVLQYKLPKSRGKFIKDLLYSRIEYIENRRK